ncbi:hypothetical protein PHYPO_G00215950 [Pangasianodon hypophthalmus]|uniref:Aftiphilin clathrin-binding box domain-containing protein n=1 Tax=Pangasianodon hypophthalmus TaxID=310915 RepID=A0A5N5P6V4_PANHP|nr:hypothetical protein PHYPO_G00215950 [Pangasianodon hypophthalmus]
MLQHNNNNNYPCLDVAHRELLHGCRRNGTTFSSALGFGAIPLIKGLRAWAVSGGYSRSKRKAAAACQASDTAHESRIGTSHRKTHSCHTPGVRQGGLGALVTVATLKDSDGGRQTQTRCLFLKAEGCNYLCAVGTRVDGRKSGKGSQDGVGICDGKPVRKWRKSSKRPKSMENISVAENKKGVASTKLELLDKCSITQCLKAKSALTAINNEEDHLNRSQFSALHEMCEPATCSPSTKYDSSTEVKEDTTLASCPELNDCEVFVRQDTPISTSDYTDKTTQISKHENDLTADVNLNHVLKSKEIGMPNSEEHSPEFGVDIHNKNGILSTNSHSHYNTTDTIKYEIDILADRHLSKSNEFGVEKSKQHGLESEVLSEDTSKTNGTLLTISHSHCEETIIPPASSNHSDDTLLTIIQVEQEIKKKIDDSSFNHDMEEIVHFGEMKKDTASASNQDINHVSEPAEEHWGSPACSSHHKQQIIMEVNVTFEDGKKLNTTNEAFEELANSLSQGSGSFNVANAITSLPNPAPTTNRTALRSISRQQQEETKGRRLVLKPALELLEKQERGQEADKVADEGPEVVDEEDGDEFGVFMKAGDEQVWNEGFHELKKVPCEKFAGIDTGNSSVSNEPPSWMSDWTRDLSIKQSEDTWTAFKQEVVSRGTEKESWFSTAVENMHLTHSSLITVPNVFLEAFPYLKSSCGDSDCIPTLAELLRGSAAENRPEKNGRQSLLDGLQDLDRMIGVKYKVAESLSRKLLLQSLELRTLKPERAGGHKHNMARFSPNLPMSNQQLAANAKRRLSYDINRNIMS